MRDAKLFTLGLVLVSIITSCNESPQKGELEAGKHDNELINAQSLPMTIAAGCEGRFAESSPWYLSISSAGTGQLIVEEESGTRVQSIEVSQTDFRELADIMRRHDYFELSKPTYGEQVSSGSTCYMAVTIGRRTIAIELHYLRSLSELRMLHDTLAIEEFEEAQRAASVFSAIRGCFDSDVAYDPRPHWRHLYDAPESSETKFEEDKP